MTGYILKCYYNSIVHDYATLRDRTGQDRGIVDHFAWPAYLAPFADHHFFVFPFALLMRDKLCHKLCDNHCTRVLIGHPLNSNIKFNLHIWGTGPLLRFTCVVVVVVWPE